LGAVPGGFGQAGNDSMATVRISVSDLSGSPSPAEDSRWQEQNGPEQGKDSFEGNPD
jgi:hypothetical protein